MIKMAPQKRIKMCCVVKCVNNSSNSKVNFFSFPKVRNRSNQRSRWLQAIKNENGCWYAPHVHSFVCSDHFVHGMPSTDPQEINYVPSIFINTKKAETIKSRSVSVKKFGLEYIKHDALLEKPSRSNASNDQRKCAYVKLAAALGIPVSMVRGWERRFRVYFDEKMAEPPDKRKPSADDQPHWLTTVAERLYANPMHRPRSAWVPVSPGGVVSALCAAARARGTLCSTALYNDVRRVLRLSSAVNDLHAVWVSAQRVSLQQVQAAARAGDAARAAPPAGAAAVADLVLLHTDVDIVTDESVTLYEESAALHTLWQLVQRHRLEDAAPAHSRVRAQRWTRAHRTYLESGRTVSLVVLQRRWYELKLQARVRLAMHWRRPPDPQLFDDLTPAPKTAPSPAQTQLELYPRPAPLHIAILKRYPHIATGHFSTWRQQVMQGTIVTEPLEEENDAKETQGNKNETSIDTTDTRDDAADKQLYPKMSKVEQPTVDEPMVKQLPDNEPFTDGPTDTDLLEEENDVKEAKSNDNEQFTDTTDTGDDAVVKQLYPNMSKVEQPTVDEPKSEQIFYNVPLVEQSTPDYQLAEHTTGYVPLAEEPTVHELKNEQSSYNVEQNTVDDQLAEHTTENDPLTEEPTVHEPKVEQTIDSGSLSDNHMAEQTTDSDLLAVQRTVDELKIEQATDLLINQSTVCTLAEIPVGRAENAATADTPDTQGGPDISSEQIHRAEDESNEVIPPKRAYSSDTDTDTEDNLVIDEYSNRTPCSFKREPVPHTETHGVDTMSPHVALENVAPTIEVLHMIDPNTVKTEIVFESDEDDFQPYNEGDNDEIELDAKNKVSFISNRIMFADEEPVSCDVKTEDDVTGRMDFEDGQIMDDPENDTPTIDPKLLMDTQVPIFRIDKTRAWKNNVRKDQSIRFSRIHRRYYTPKTENKSNNTKKCTQNTHLDEELRSSARLTASTAETQEIRVDNSCLDKVANTHSIRQLCRNIKRELIEHELLEGEIPNKKAKTESDSDDEKPLLVLREGHPPRETTDETSCYTVDRDMVEESSSDDELMNDEMFNNVRGEERKRGRGVYAASTIEWSAAFAPALGRVAKRVSLPDIEQVRRYNSGMQVAQVAPITTTESTSGDDGMQAGQPPGDAAADDTPEAAAAAPAQHAELDPKGLLTLCGNKDMPYGLLPSSRMKPPAWRALDLPAHDELQAALDDLTTAPAAEAVLERSHCCAARRHREVNDTRRRIGLVEIPLHNHPDGVCACCCAHLSDVDARCRLDQQLRALHEDIEKMLRKSAGGRIQSKPAQKHPPSPSPAEASTSATTATSATMASSATMATAATSAHKPATSARKPATSAHKPATSAHKPATSAHKPATKDAPSNTATVAKGSKAKPATYTNRAKKRRSRARAAPGPAPEPEPPAPPVDDYEEWQRQKNMNAKYFHINGNVPFKKDKITTAQGTAVQSTTAQGTALQSTSVQTATKQNTSTQSHQQNVLQPGLMPYIRQSRLVTPLEEPPRARHAKPGPPPPGTRPVNIAPKLADMHHAPEHAQLNTVGAELATRTEGTKNLTIPISPITMAPFQSNPVTNLVKGYQSRAIGPRRMNLTTEQVSKPNSQPVQPMTANSVPTDKPLSILEEYSRTLSTEPVSNTPVVNALSLRVPAGPQGPKTTILMALTLPSDDVIKQTINRLYANETVDLTEEPERSMSVITTADSKQKTQYPVDLVRAFKNLIHPVNKNNSGRSLLKPATQSEGKSLLKTTITNALDKPHDTTEPTPTVPTRDTAPNIMSLSSKLHDGDVIEIDDTDSNQSSSSDGNQSTNSNKSSILINKSSNPAVYTNKGSNQAKSNSTKESFNQSISRTVKSSNQAASNSREAVSNTNNSTEDVSKTNECSTQAIEDKNKSSSQANRKKESSIQAREDKDKSSQKIGKTKSCSKEKYNRFTKPAVFKRANVSVEAVTSHSMARPCSRIPVLTSLTDGSLRCPARFANVAAMTDFMATLRRAATQDDKEVYCHKWSAVEQPVSALPCGGTLLCVDGSRPPLVLPALERRDQRDRAAPHPRAHLVLTDADPPCALPTYWTLAAFGQIARVMPDELVSTDPPDVSDAPDAADAEPGGGGARWCAARGEWVTPKEDRKICEKNHNFKILTAFCSADGIRQAARAGASLLLLSVLRARVVVLTLTRHVLHGVVRHRASADVEGELLRELEGLLDEAEVAEIVGGRADFIGQ